MPLPAPTKPVKTPGARICGLKLELELNGRERVVIVVDINRVQNVADRTGNSSDRCRFEQRIDVQE